MGRYFPDTANDYLYMNNAPLSTEPLTVCAWFKAAHVNNIQPIAFLVNGSVASTYFGIHIRGHELNDPFAAIERANFSQSIWSSKPSSISVGTWQHGAGVFQPTDWRLCYVDGSAGTLSTGAITTPTGLNQIRIGSEYEPFNERFQGGIAEVAFWNIALSGSAIADMATGKSALYYPNNLVFYARLLEDEDYDEIGDNYLSINGNPTTTDHPLIDYGDKYGPKIQVI